MEKLLEDSEISCAVFDETVANPTVANVEAARALYLNEHCQALIAFGGGSSMDCAKAVGARIARPQKPLSKMEGILHVLHKLPLLIAIPSTAGTGSETTLAAVITDEKTHHKYPINDFSLIPAYAVLEPEVTLGLPASLTATTGMDALTHAIEGYITKAAWELSDMFEIEAIRLINKYLRTAVYDPKNPKGRSGMALAQYVAGMAFSNVGLGVVHGMAHPMGSLFDIPHGVANALLLPTIMEFNKPVCIEKYVEIAKAMDAYKDGMTKAEAAQAACDAVRALAIEVGIPQHLSDLGITEKDIDALADQAIEDVCTPGNPRLVTRQDIVDLYKKVL